MDELLLTNEQREDLRKRQEEIWRLQAEIEMSQHEN